MTVIRKILEEEKKYHQLAAERVAQLKSFSFQKAMLTRPSVPRKDRGWLFTPSQPQLKRERAIDASNGEIKSNQVVEDGDRSALLFLFSPPPRFCFHLDLSALFLIDNLTFFPFLFFSLRVAKQRPHFL